MTYKFRTWTFIFLQLPSLLCVCSFMCVIICMSLVLCFSLNVFYFSYRMLNETGWMPHSPPIIFPKYIIENEVNYYNEMAWTRNHRRALRCTSSRSVFLFSAFDVDYGETYCINFIIKTVVWYLHPNRLSTWGVDRILCIIQLWF